MIAHDYKDNPNWFEPARVSILLTSTFASADADKEAIVSACHKFLVLFAATPSDLITKKYLKTVKATLMREVTACINAGSSCIEHFNAILRAEPEKTRALSIIMSLARWPEWFLRKERDLADIVANLPVHKDEINAITYYETSEDGSQKRICPYDPAVYHDDMDLFGTMKAQSKAVEEYCSREGIHSEISWEDIRSCMQDIENEINLGRPTDEFEQGFFESIRFIRQHIRHVEATMLRYQSGRAESNDFGLSETRSTLSDIPSVMGVLKLLGWNKPSCPNVLANIFHCQFPSIGLQKQPGQYELPIDAEYFTVAAGLGPALKIRYVFNTSIEIQNYLSPLADLIKRADEACDLDQEAYNDQLGGLMRELPRIKDAYCIDATGYSDYLFRGVYAWLLRLYGLSDMTICSIMSIFRMPLLIGDERVKVEFGSMQGCKLLVFVMNHANRLIGIIARRLKSGADSRHNCGDDVVTAQMHRCFEESEMVAELKVFSWFNCAINPSKTAWLKRDGYFDFCSKYFYRCGDGCVSITGLPPKLVGKQMLSIKSFTEIFRVLDKTENVRNSVHSVWEVAKCLLWPEFEAGCRLPNCLGVKWEIEEKVKEAENLPFSMGGLREEGEVSRLAVLRHVKQLLEKLLQNFRFQAKGVFLVLQTLGIEGTPLYSALGTVETQGLLPIVQLISDVSAAEESNEINEELLDRAKLMITKMDRCIINGISISNTSSTYHRVTAKRDIDTLIPKDMLTKDTVLVDQVASPGTFMELALLVNAAGDDLTDVDKLRKYIQARNILTKNIDRLVQETHGLYTNWYLIDDDHLRLKLTTQDRQLGANQSKSYKMRKDVINPDIGFLYDCLAGDREVLKHLSSLINGYFRSEMVGLLTERMRDMAQRSIYRTAQDFQRQMSKDLIRNTLHDILRNQSKE